MPTVQENVSEFDKKNGSDGVLIGSFYIYSNGAMRDQDMYGPLNDPPADPHQLAKIQYRYHSYFYEKGAARFMQLKQNLIAEAQNNLRSSNASPAPTDELLHLEKLRDEVKALQDRLEEAEKKVEDTVPEHVRQRAAYSDANKDKNQAFLKSITNIQI